ncbi:hypothetical protein GFK26_08910 [Variovorax paradoxus]|uniref:Uncharacterized protein n=1 Tax=Variovorax paradoxus TaxID=34073 RepID=A0A5Q0LZV4_VARPD|nr:hypothetical protein [Variovorax paradoxus]QFZ82871.1 hypothetical protein GFK26_08910 [Variovorax paradoxus]
MTDGTARAKFSLADGRIEIEGSEAFVMAQLAKLEPLLAKLIEQRPAPSSSAPITSAAAGNGATAGASAAASVAPGLDAYLNLFALADEKIQILKSLPGSSKSGKTLAAAQLLTLANELNGKKATNIEEIRSTCTAHACLDRPNFATTFKGASAKEWFTFSGTGATQTISLTYPGRVKAKELANLLNK